ncbi:MULTISPECIES: DeoR/GlpR family DNA-binding transcription regulator [unclassified Micromonospora]|uniref:DeoR/GlpR family DNA-binding transcription regulator n=1 Tax=unclassified Micromonospora TaxID=2617518 RepID=UPI002E24FC7C|nr:DeoR/GlpR family DNA-binding transcription regulator [Micromonospora sp. NBC_00858]
MTDPRPCKGHHMNNARSNAQGTVRQRERKTETRQRQIAERVAAEGSCSPQELASAFNVSIMTIHRDLEQLERRGIVRRFHGGVTAQPSGVFESQMSYRMMSRTEEKSAIAAAAMRHVDAGMSVLLDDSTTVMHMIEGLGERAPLHVATTFLEGLRRLSQLATETDLTVIGLGGVYDVPHDSFVGLQTIEQIAGLQADALFLSTSAISLTDAFHQEERIVALKRAMVQAATRRYLLVDHSKLGRVALHKIVPLDVFDLVITDAGADPKVLAAWDAAGIRYEVAS